MRWMNDQQLVFVQPAAGVRLPFALIYLTTILVENVICGPFPGALKAGSATRAISSRFFNIISIRLQKHRCTDRDRYCVLLIYLSPSWCRDKEPLFHCLFIEPAIVMSNVCWVACHHTFDGGIISIIFGDKMLLAGIYSGSFLVIPFLGSRGCLPMVKLRDSRGELRFDVMPWFIKNTRGYWIPQYFRVFPLIIHQGVFYVCLVHVSVLFPSITGTTLFSRWPRFRHCISAVQTECWVVVLSNNAPSRSNSLRR
jgi:hypothetical protein